MDPIGNRPSSCSKNSRTGDRFTARLPWQPTYRRNLWWSNGTRDAIGSPNYLAETVGLDQCIRVSNLVLPATRKRSTVVRTRDERFLFGRNHFRGRPLQSEQVGDGPNSGPNFRVFRVHAGFESGPCQYAKLPQPARCPFSFFE